MATKNGTPDQALGDLYPFEDKFVELDNGLKMHYIEKGRAGLRKPTILLLHGNPTWSFLYRQFMGPLAKFGRVIAVDHIGFGRSDHPEGAESYSLEGHISNLEDFCAKLGLKRVVLAVQDWGGPIGLGYATRHPDTVAGLFIMNTWAFADAAPMKLPFWFKRMTHGRIGDAMIGGRNAFVEDILPRLLVTRPTEAVMDGYRHPFPTKVSRAGVVAFPRMIPTGPKHPEWATMQSIQDALPNINAPARIVWGLKDPAFSKREAHLFHEMLPAAEAPIWLPEAGHFLQEDATGDVLQHFVDFLRQL